MKAIKMTKMTIKNLPTAILWAALVTPLTLAGCGGGEPPHTGTAPAAERAPVAVPVATLAAGTVAETVEASGSLEPWRRVSPASKLLGRIDRLAVREGDRVERGDLLARLEGRDLEAAVRQAEAAVTMTEAELENARAQHQRMETLLARGSVTVKNLEDAVARFRGAEAGKVQAEANLAAARVMLSYATLTSPLDGWVVARHVETGDMAHPGMPLVTVEDLSRMKVRLAVPEAQVVRLAPGLPSTVTVLDRRIPAVIDRIVPAGDPGSRTFEVQLVLDNPEGWLKSGMFARALFPVGERRVLRLPASAVIERGQLEGVFMVDGERARLRWIDTGRRDGDQVEVTAGVSEGELYVSTPPPGLEDGDPVTVSAGRDATETSP